MYIFNKGVAVLSCNVIVTEIPIVLYAVAIKFVKYIFYTYSRNTQKRCIDFVVLTELVKQTVVHYCKIIQLFANFFFVTVKTGDKFKAELFKVHMLGNRFTEVAGTDKYSLDRKSVV